MRGRGCQTCGGTGYRGRTAVYEMLPVTAMLRSVLLAGGDEHAVAAAARAAGMVSLRDNGLLKAHRGETTYEEVLRVTTVDTHVEETAAARAAPAASRRTWCAAPGARPRCMAAGAAPAAASSSRTGSSCPWCATDVRRSPAGRSPGLAVPTGASPACRGAGVSRAAAPSAERRSPAPRR